MIPLSLPLPSLPLTPKYPQWVFELPNKNLRLMKRGSDVFDASIKRFIDERQRSGAINDDRHDLLALLLAANESEKGEAVLNDAELFSDVCIFLLAGHGELRWFFARLSDRILTRSPPTETSANTLSCLLVLLALYPEHQHAVHAEAVSVFSTLSTLNSTSYASTFPRLPIALATLQEGMRLAGPVLMMSKVAIADTVLPARTNEGERTQVFVPKGAIIREHVAGMHYHCEHTHRLCCLCCDCC